MYACAATVNHSAANSRSPRCSAMVASIEADAPSSWTSDAADAALTAPVPAAAAPATASESTIPVPSTVASFRMVAEARSSASTSLASSTRPA